MHVLKTSTHAYKHSVSSIQFVPSLHAAVHAQMCTHCRQKTDAKIEHTNIHAIDAQIHTPGPRLMYAHLHIEHASKSEINTYADLRCASNQTGTCTYTAYMPLITCESSVRYTLHALIIARAICAKMQGTRQWW